MNIQISNGMEYCIFSNKLKNGIERKNNIITQYKNGVKHGLCRNFSYGDGVILETNYVNGIVTSVSRLIKNGKLLPLTPFMQPPSDTNIYNIEDFFKDIDDIKTFKITMNGVTENLTETLLSKILS